jgi:hypothetical protein
MEGIKQLVTIKSLTKSFGPSKIKVNNTVLTNSKSVTNTVHLIIIFILSVQIWQRIKYSYCQYIILRVLV